MKITFIYHKCYMGGIESAVKSRMDFLQDLGTDCEIIFFQHGFEKKVFGTHKCFIAEDERKLAFLTRGSDILVTLSPFDIVFKKLYKLHQPVIHECHGGEDFSYLSTIDGNRVKAVIFPSAIKMNDAGKYLFKDIKAFALPNCLSKDFFKTDNSPIDTEYRIVLWVGRIEANKNWRILIELAKQLPDTYLIQVVSDLSLSSEYPEYSKEVEKYHLENRIQLIPNCEYSKMPYFYCAAALRGCYISSSYTESFGMTLLEAMAVNCPMILSDLPVFREVAKDGALYFRPDEVDTCLNNILMVCEDSKERNKLIKRESMNFTMNYNSIELCRRYLEIIHGVINN